VITKDLQISQMRRHMKEQHCQVMLKAKYCPRVYFLDGYRAHTKKTQKKHVTLTFDL